MMEQRSPSFNVYNQRNFSSGLNAKHQTLTRSRLERNTVSNNKKKEPTILLPKYSQDFMLRQQHIEELRLRRLQQLDTDPLAHRHTGQSMQVPTADNSKLHISRRTFGLQVNQVRYNTTNLLYFNSLSTPSLVCSSYHSCFFITGLASTLLHRSRSYRRQDGLYQPIEDE